MDIKNALDKLWNIPTTDPEDVRQRKLLRALLAIMVTTTLIQEVVVLFLVIIGIPPAPISADPSFFWQGEIGTVIALLFAGLVFLVNRYWSVSLSKALYILFLGVVLYGNTPDDWTLATMTYGFSIPIVIISFLMGPYASLALAGLGSIATSVAGILLGTGIYVTPIFNFFAVSMLAWFTARTLNNALTDLRVLNVELDQRVQDRTRDLAEALAKNQAILDSTADGVIVFDNDGTAVVANPSITELLGRPAEEITGRNIETLMGGRVDAKDQETVIGLLRSKETQRSGLKIRWGEKRTLSVSMAPVRDDSERVTGTVAVFRDFTREAEVDRMKSTFVSIASHELRTPLNAIMGYVEMLRENVYGPITEQQRGALERVVANTGHMLGLVNNLLDRARIEAGTLHLNLTTFSPTELVVQVRGVMDMLAQAKGLKLTTHIADDVPAKLTGDQQRLQQILINLAGNAIKFTEKGTVSIRVYKSDAEHWALEVIDTGVGIPEEAQSYIFEPFRQVDDSATREYGGAGLGLSIVKQIVSLMGGEIVLKSEIGKGSTFTISLPLTPSETPSIFAA